MSIRFNVILLFIFPLRLCLGADQAGSTCYCKLEDDSFYDSTKRDVECRECFPNSTLAASGEAIYQLKIGDFANVTLPSHPFPFAVVRLQFDNVIIDFLRSPVNPNNHHNPFRQLSDSLEVLEIIRSGTLYTWDWQLFRDFKKLETLIITDSPLHYIAENFSQISPDNLRNFEITGAQVQWIHERVFQNYTNLQFLSLMNNSLHFLDDQVFNGLSNRIWFLDLSNNLISDLNGENITELPDLKELYLNDNALTTLNYTFFEKLNCKLDELWIDGNDLMCDENDICWLHEKMTETSFWKLGLCLNNTRQTISLADVNCSSV